MSQENYSIADCFRHHPGMSPPSRNLLTLACPRFNSSFARISLPNNQTTSSNTDPYSPESFTNVLPFNRGRAARRRNDFRREPKTSDLFPGQFRDQLEARLQEKISFLHEDAASPLPVEPESSSSQPSEPYSASLKDNSPFTRLGPPRRKRSWENIFTEDFYRRINDFLDTEGLDLADPADCVKGIRSFSRLREGSITSEDEMSEIKGVQSATQSPKLICDTLHSSSLFQRRASRSQGPGQDLDNEQSNGNSRPMKLKLFKHFNDHVNNISQMISPIEEKNTPVISRNNSGYQLETPKRLSAKKSNFRHFVSPDRDNKNREELRHRNALTQYTSKHTRSFKSPNIEANFVEAHNTFNFLKSSKDLKTTNSVSSTPKKPNVGDSPRRQLQIPQTNGAVIKKSRFQKLSDLQNLHDSSPKQGFD